MREAFKAARASATNGDYPMGAVLVKNDTIISVGYETLKSANDPVNGHAEIDAIRKACAALKQSYLEGCTLYSTHEPCPMCAAAAFWAKVGTIVFSVSREKMIEQMENKQRKSSDKFSWRQIAISCKDVIAAGKGPIEIITGVLEDEGCALFDLAQ